jgi:hypothetical protein
MTAQTTTPTALAAKAAAMAAGLRALAADIESGALSLPYDVQATAFWALTDDGGIGERLTTEDARATMAAAPGNWSKDLSGNWATYSKSYGGGVAYDISMNREQVCRKVQVGTREIPATDARTEPVYDWVCDPGADAE